MKLSQIFKRSSRYQSLNTITIDASAILHNLQVLQNLRPNQKIIPVLKSNAYGHGLKQVCQILSTTSNETTPLLAVDSYPEYQIVRDTTHKSILVLGETLPENYRFYNPRRAQLAVGSLPVLQSLIKTGKRRTIHLFVNTGMNREGFQMEGLLQALQLLAQHKQITVIGVMSHLATADDPNDSFVMTQYDRFVKFLEIIQKSGHRPAYIHLGNSAGLSKLPNNTILTAHRVGLAFYGYNPLSEVDPHYDDYHGLKPALRILSTITSIQILHSGEGVNYGLSWETNKATRIATLPFGYHEGLPRRSGKDFFVYYNNTPLPIVGRVCMNLSSIEIGEHDLQIGDQIEIIGTDPQHSNTIEYLAQTNTMIPYEILVQIDRGLKRVVV